MNLERGVIRKAFAREHLTYLKKDNDTDIESAEFQGESMKRHVIEKFQNTQVKTNPLRIQRKTSDSYKEGRIRLASAWTQVTLMQEDDGTIFLNFKHQFV